MLRTFTVFCFSCGVVLFMIALVDCCCNWFEFVSFVELLWLYWFASIVVTCIVVRLLWWFSCCFVVCFTAVCVII